MRSEQQTHKMTALPADTDTVATSLQPRQWANVYADYLYTFARKRIWDDDLARDLVQDTFLAALERMEKFEGRSSERTWLTAILKHKIMDVYRKKSSLKSVVNASVDVNDLEFFEENGHWKEAFKPKNFGLEQQDLLERKEFNAILKICMEKLPGLWLAVFSLKFIDDEKSEVICNGLKITAANYWVIIHRAKLNLRACLQNNGLYNTL